MQRLMLSLILLTFSLDALSAQPSRINPCNYLKSSLVAPIAHVLDLFSTILGHERCLEINQTLLIKRNLFPFEFEHLKVPVKRILPPENFVRGKNIIYSFGNEQTDENKALLADTQEIFFERVSRWQTRPMRIELIENALRTALNLPVENNSELAIQIDGFFDSTRSQLFNNYVLFDDFILKAIKKATLDWEYRGAAQADDIYNDLRQGKVENAILILDGDPNRLQDAKGNYLPSGFFDSISANVRSLAIYSRNADKLFESYSLGSKARPSFFSSRSVFIPVTAGKITNYGIPEFIAKVDKALSLPAVPVDINRWDHEEEPKKCALSFDGFISSGTIYSFTLNRRLIGLSKRAKDHFEFDCEIASQRTPPLLIVAAISSGYPTDAPSVAEIDETFRISLTLNDQTLKDVKPRNFGRWTANEVYSSSKHIFSDL